MLKLKTIQDRGAGMAAVFYRQGFFLNEEIVLNEESLRIRIANLERAGLDASSERSALDQMVGRIRLRWTCCNACHKAHKTLLAARLHWLYLRFIGVA